MLLHPQIKDELKQLQQQMIADGELPARDKLNSYYQTFRDRFGPERLSNLDGEDLLYTMHGHRSTYRDSLVYWLEFKNDEEFPAILGSIAGGSSYKFGIYQRKEDSIWMTGPITTGALAQDSVAPKVVGSRCGMVIMSPLVGRT